MNRVTLVTGGARSGKSAHALTLAAPAQRRLFIATAEPFDDEMRVRIAAHKKERGDDYVTFEAPLDPAEILSTHGEHHDVAVLDCLTVWLGNLMHHHSNAETFCEVDGLLSCLRHPPCDLILVANELGMGLVPEHPMSRQFRDMAGRLNQQVAALSTHVVFMISGIPLCVKETSR